MNETDSDFSNLSRGLAEDVEKKIMTNIIFVIILKLNIFINYMVKKNNLSPTKLIKYLKLINYNLIYNNKAINRYKKDNFEISADKAYDLEKLKRSITNVKNCGLK